MVGDQGRRAAATVAAVADPDEPVVLVIPDFESVVMPIVYADVPERPDLRPIAKLSRGISLALVVPSVSEWRSWSALTSAKHQKPLRVATAGSRSTTGLFATILAKLGGFPIEHGDRHHRPRGRAGGGRPACRRGGGHHLRHQADEHDDQQPLVPIITSGAARSPDFPDTPTISEITGDRRARLHHVGLGFRIQGDERRSRGAAHTGLPRRRAGSRGCRRGSPDELSSAGRRPGSGQGDPGARSSRRHPVPRNL